MSKIESKSTSAIKRVAIYCRTNNKNQLKEYNSYIATVEEFQKKVMSNPNWQLIDTYSDIASSSKTWQKRSELSRMFQACKDGEIDLIVTPSFSRISRYSTDAYDIIRHIKSMNIVIYFETENIYSTDKVFDIMLTIFSSISSEYVKGRKKP